MPGIQVQNLDHLGLIAGIIDEMELVEQINQRLGQDPREKVSAGQVVKALILNGLGFVSAPLYLFSRFFEGKATEHLLGEGVRPEHLNEDRIGRVLDQLHIKGLTDCFVSVAMKATAKFGIKVTAAHLDSTSFHLHGEYAPTSRLNVVETKQQPDGTEVEQPVGPQPIHLTYGYSRDHRSDLKQFVMNLICSGDGDVPLFLELADGNQTDKTRFAQLMQEFRQQWTFEGLYVADSALYSADNIKRLQALKWITRVPQTVAEAKQLLQQVRPEELVPSALAGYRLAQHTSHYAGVEQRWLIVESQARQQADLQQLQAKLDRAAQTAQGQLQQLEAQEFGCELDALTAAERLAAQLRYHQLATVKVREQAHYEKRGRPGKHTQPSHLTYHLQLTLLPNQHVIEPLRQQAGRFILATNVLAAAALSDDALLQEYKQQQAAERGFRFLKDPLFFTDSVFLHDPGRIAALGFLMGLCLLVYNLAQRALRQALAEADATINNQLGQPTQQPTLRWVFQCFQAVHLLVIDGLKQIANLTDERLWILRFFSQAGRAYYLLC